MTAVVFLGPTLPVEEARRTLDAVYLPPVRQGDIWRLTSAFRPSAIGIVDGYFERVPAVWHKEILWALRQGIPVVGAASMGALRAIELLAFGMLGIGKVFEAYRSGRLPPDTEPFEDDDEVAVVHGPAESGYLASDALVNMRFTLARACAEGVIDAAERDTLIRLAKGIFYKDRSYDELLRRATGDVPAEALATLRRWLPGGRIDQKKADAIELLGWIREHPDFIPDARFRFEATTFWEHGLEANDGDAAAAIILTEHRLQGRASLSLREQTRAALAEAPSMRAPPEISALIGLDPEAASSAVADEARRVVVARRRHRHRPLERLADEGVLAHLQARGEAERLRARGEAKAKRLAALDLPRPDADGCSPSTADLLAWFAPRLGEAAGADAEAIATWLGFESADELCSALLAEYLFVTADREN